MKYGFDLGTTPYDQLITMLRWQSERNDAKAKERKDDYMKLMQMLGRGVGALKANSDYKNYLKDQADWNDEISFLDDVENLPYTPSENMPFMDYSDDDAWLNSRFELAKLGL